MSNTGTRSSGGGRICKGKECVPVPFLTTTWTIDQIREVYRLQQEGYSPYKIARLVHRRTVDVYQLIYNKPEVTFIITELETPRNYIIYQNVKYPARYISTEWRLQQVIEVLNLSSQGYSPYKIARIVHKRTVDVYQIIYHRDYFIRLVGEILYTNQGVLYLSSNPSYHVPFEFSGEYYTQEVCKMEKDNDILIQLGEDEYHNFMAIGYKPKEMSERDIERYIQSPTGEDVVTYTFRLKSEASLMCILIAQTGLDCGVYEVPKEDFYPSEACELDTFYNAYVKTGTPPWRS